MVSIFCSLTTSALLIAAVLFSCTYEAQVQAQSASYYVVPSNVSIPSKCSSNVTCLTLDEYITDGTLNDSYSKFVFLNGTHHLTKSLMVYDSESLTLQGSEEGNNSVQVVCESRWTIALSFTRVSFLTIQNISFVNCSYNNSFTGSKVTEYVISALHFEGGSNLTLSDVRILNGGFSIINTHGHVEIIRMNVSSDLFIHRKRDNKILTHSFGGSFYRYFACGTQLNLTIVDSNFLFNNKHYFKLQGKYSASGLGIRFNCSNLQISVIKTNFHGFESVGHGGNLMIRFSPETQYTISNDNYMVTISQCQIVKGHAMQGGGTYVFLKQNSMTFNSQLATGRPSIQKHLAIHILDTQFLDNSALGGGGLDFKLEEFSKYPLVGYIKIERCEFFRNYLKTEHSHGGIAIQLSSFHVTPSTYHYTPSFSITLKECSIRDNYILGDDSCSPGNGVITAIKNLHFHIIDSELIQNYCTAIKAIASNLLLEGQVNITDNHGSSGGGLLLCDDSVIVLKPNTQVRITNNNATHTGGGIIVENQCLQTRPMCFFQLSEEVNNSSLLDTIEVVLTNNTAGFAGRNLFGGFVDDCYLVRPPKYLYYKLKTQIALAVFNRIFVNMSLTNSSVTSTARRICFCNKGQKNCSQETLPEKKYPGELFLVSAVPVGQLNGDVPASIQAVSDGISHSEQTQNIGKSECTDLVYIVRSNRPFEHIDLHIQHEGDVSGYIKLDLFKKVTINVTLKNCPVGFKLERKCHRGHFHHCVCKFDDVLLNSGDKSLKSNITKTTITKSSWLWIGYIRDPYENKQNSERYLTFHICPLDYCKIAGKNQVNSIVLEYESMDDSQCQFNRRGILCGACGQNLSMIMGSSKCWHCSNSYLLLILPFALAGIMLIMLLTVCNFTTSEGKMGGLIFFANILHISDTLFISAGSPALSSLLKAVIAWINLDFGIHICMCFYNGMDAYAKAWLQFVFPLYLWILSGLIVFLCNRYISVTRLFGTNSVRVLATVILLSFTKLLRAVITTLSCVNLPLYKNGTVERTRYLWMSDPNILCLRGKHIPLFFFGLLFSILWSIFIVFLLFIQCWPRLRCCSRIQRLKPFTDSFTGPNTSHGRFWTGLLLLSRSVIAVAYCFCANGILRNHFYASIAVSCVCLLLISACLPSGVYTKRSNNLLETFFLLQLLFTTFSAGKQLYNYAYVSVSLALIVFSCILVYHCWRRFKHTRCATILGLKIAKRIKRCFKKREVVEESGDIFIDGSAHPKYSTFTQDREPLLASLDSYH